MMIRSSLKVIILIIVLNVFVIVIFITVSYLRVNNFYDIFHYHVMLLIYSCHAIGYNFIGFLEVKDLSDLSFPITINIFHLLQYFLLILLRQVDESFLGSLTWMHSEDLLIGLFLVFKHWLPNQILVPKKGPGFELHCDLGISLHHFEEAVAAYCLAVHVWQGLVEKLRPPLEHDRNVTYWVSIAHFQS